jgi:glutathione S-transferase
MPLQLYIGNKNYSSWSMRPWVLMRQLDIEFEEVRLRFDFGEGSAFRETVAQVSPAGRVPVLVDDGFAVWDTLAIVEYLHDRFPTRGIWPADRRQRARARSLCAEMHAGFGALRNHCPMNIEADLALVGQRIWAEHSEVRGDVARVDQAWVEQLAASGGPMLFGAFTAADAFFAPVCSRLRTYGLPTSDGADRYVRQLMASAGVADWLSAARAERDFLDFEEPYRTAPEASVSRSGH